MAFSPDSGMLAAACAGELVLLSSTERSRAPARIKLSSIVNALAFMPDGGYIAAGGQDAVVGIWDWRRAERIRIMQGHLGKVRSLAVSCDGTRILSGCAGGLLMLWDGERGDCLGSYNCRAPVWSVRFTHGEEHAVCACSDGILLWDLASGRVLDKHAAPVRSPVFLDVVPPGRLAVTGSFDGAFRLWDLYG